jgi:hypothetical protein
MAKAIPVKRHKLTSGQERRRPHVALIIETSLGSGRDILRGVARYVREHEPWALYHEPHGLEESVPQWLRHWNGDGIIARIQTRRIAQQLAASGIPVVDVLGVVPALPFPLVHVDNVAIARWNAAFGDSGFSGLKARTGRNSATPDFAPRWRQLNRMCRSTGCLVMQRAGALGSARKITSPVGSRGCRSLPAS